MNDQALQPAAAPGVYFNLLKTFTQRGCPVCHEVQRLSLRSLRFLFHERVNDGGVRKALRESKGLCNWHGWTARDLPNSNTGLAIIFKDLLDREIQSLAALEQHHSDSSHSSAGMRGREDFIKGLHDYLRSWSEKRACPECRQLSSHERYVIKTLVDSLGDKTFAEKFAGSEGLCFPHFTYTLGAFNDHPNLSFLLIMQRGKFESLSSELGEFIRKRDYKFTDEPVGLEADAWIRVTELFAGKRNIFGPSRFLTVSTPHVLSWFQRLKRIVALFFRSEPEEPSLALQPLLELSDEAGQPGPSSAENEWKQKYMELSSRAAALHYQLHKVDADRKALEMHYAASDGEVKTSKLLIEKLRNEIDELKRNKEDSK